jgi:putative FmdB family regulatory protein
MPVYEYRCTKCEKEFEYQQRMSDPPMAVCEACGGELERLISRTAFQLKGSGWYKDLYSSSKPAESKAAEGTPGESKAGESKPAETSTTKPEKPSGGGGDSGSSGTSGSSGGSSGGSGGGSSGSSVTAA